MLTKTLSDVWGLAVVLTIMILTASPAVAQESGWTLVRDRKEVKVHTRKVAGSAIHEYRGVTEIKTSLASLVALLDDTASYTSWVKYCTEAWRVSRIGPTEHITYFQLKVPLFSKRDVTVHSTSNQDPQRGVVTMVLTKARTAVAERSGIVRVRTLKGNWQFIPGKNGVKRIVYQLHMTPGGRLDNWGLVVNPYLKDQIYHTLLNMREIVQRPVYQQARYNGLKEVGPWDSN